MKLKELKRFINHKNKVPYVNGKYIKWSDESTFLTYEQALKNAKEQNLGISIVLGSINNEYNLAGIDYDTICDNNGNIDYNILEDLKLFKHNHKSLSGYGYHSLCLVKKQFCLDKGNRTKINSNLNINRLDEKGNKKIPEIEFYLSNRTFAIPLNLDICEDDIVDSTEEYKKVYLKYMSDKKTYKKRNNNENDESRKDYALISEYIKKGYSKEEAIKEFKNSSYALNKDEKHKKKLEREDYLERTFDNAEDCILGGEGSSNLKVNEVLNLLKGNMIFIDERNISYMVIDNKNVIIDSKTFDEYVEGLCFENKVNLGTQTLNKLKNILCYRAKKENNKFTLNVRFSGDENIVYYQLNEKELIKIDECGYQIIENNVPRFRWHNNMLEQIKPQNSNGNIKLTEIFEFLNIPEEQKLIFLVYLISLFIPNIPKPILILSAEKGAGKTTATKLIKDLVDPSVLDTSSLSNDEKTLLILLDHSAVVNFDNLQTLTTRQSDILCRAYSGDAILSRQLYSNDDEFIMQYKRAIILNGIDCPAYKSDLLDRSIIIDLKRINKSSRKTESDIFKNWNEKKPYFLHDILVTISHSLRIYHTIKLDELERFADWQKWGYAIATAINPKCANKFLEDVKKNVLRQDEEVIEKNDLVRILLEFMKDKKEWGGTPSDLLKELKIIELDFNVSIITSASALSRKIKEQNSLFENQGLFIDKRVGTGNIRQITIKNKKFK